MTIAFDAKIENNVIPIPDVYRNLFSNNMLVTVSLVNKKKPITKENIRPFIDTNDWTFNRDESDEKNPNVAYTREERPISKDDFTCITIDTSTFKFNREEANER